jgi:hypothetical protein
MRRSIRSSILTIAILGLAVLPGLAPAQESEPTGLSLEEMRVFPDRAADFEAAMEEFLPFLVANDFPNMFYTFVGEDMTYYFSSPAKDLAEVGEQWKAWQGFMAKVGMDDLQPLLEKFTGIYEYSQQAFWRYRPDLSYSSDPPKWDPEEATFHMWVFAHVKPGMEPQFEAGFKKFVDLFSEKKVSWGWETYAGEFGTEAPVYVWGEVGPSIGVFHTEAEKIEQALGDAGMNLWLQVVQTVRRLEVVRATYRPDLSYLPGGEEE